MLNRPLQYNPYALDYCCIGDQNRDGFDDLMVSGRVYDREEREVTDTVQIHIYHGSEEMDQTPDIIFTTLWWENTIGDRINYIGNLLPDHSPFVAIQSRMPEEDRRISFFELTEDFDFDLEFSVNTDLDHAQWISPGYWRSPCDLNGDGFNDLLITERLDTTYCRLNIYFGGGDFDTIPDWSYTYEMEDHIRSIQTHTGYDVNGDDFDDLLVYAGRENVWGERVESFWQLFLGGEDMDSIPDLHINHREIFENRGVSGFRLLQDMNGDGYDEIGATYNLREGDGYGYVIFLGSEEPNLDTYISFEGEHGRGTSFNQLIGGDFNGDGYGDLVIGSSYGWFGTGAMTIHFGSPWYNGESSIVVRFPDETLGEDFYSLGSRFGAVGDYNGDGVDDFVEGTGRLIVFAGNRDWEVGVESHPIPEQYEIEITAHPNPFNFQTNITYQIPTESHLDIALYDISGRHIMTQFSGVRQAGEWSTTLNGSNLSSGIYFVRMNAGSDSRMQKVVLIK